MKMPEYIKVSPAIYFDLDKDFGKQNDDFFRRLKEDNFNCYGLVLAYDPHEDFYVPTNCQCLKENRGMLCKKHANEALVKNGLKPISSKNY